MEPLRQIYYNKFHKQAADVSSPALIKRRSLKFCLASEIPYSFISVFLNQSFNFVFLSIIRKKIHNGGIAAMGVICLYTRSSCSRGKVLAVERCSKCRSGKKNLTEIKAE